jgi:hypothetical protein
MKDQRWNENAGVDGYPTNDRQLSRVIVPEHKHTGTEIPDKTDQQESSKHVMVCLSSS